MKKHRSIRARSQAIILGGCIFLLFVLKWNNARSQSGCEFSPYRAAFQVKFKDEICPYQVMGVFVLPGELLSLEATGSSEENRYHFLASAGRVTRTQTNRWFWRAPQKTGLYQISIYRAPASDSLRQAPPVDSVFQASDPFSITLNVFVMVPFEEIRDERLNGFRIGRYPGKPLKGLSIYKPPRGFIEITEENQETLISPHFRIKQFLCKQECVFPKYLVLQERLLLKLERILEEFNQRGHCSGTLHIMSGYRTPYYNKLIENVKYSRHLWGDAVDFFIDESPRDEMMDDINGDGRIDYHDAVVLNNIIEEISKKPWYSRLLGGLGWYKKTSSHGPFVHVDTRGWKARW